MSNTVTVKDAAPLATHTCTSTTGDRCDICFGPVQKKMLEVGKVRCEECGWQGKTVEVDCVQDPRPNPNQIADIWNVCPECRTPEVIRVVCDEPGCDREGNCGTMTQEYGYRWTCGTHAPWNTRKET